MLAVLFGVIVLASLGTSTLIALDVIPGSPGVLAIVGGAHALFGWLFLRGYLGYRALHRLVQEGQGELFDLAIGHRIAHGRFRGFRDHYRLRRIQGLTLTGLPRQALAAAEDYQRHARQDRHGRLETIAAEAAADLQLGQAWWAEEALRRATGVRGAEQHAELQAVRARLAHARGDAEQAATALAPLARAGFFPLTRVIRARNLCWYGEALEAVGRDADADAAFRRAVRAAPRSLWGRLAERRSLATAS